MTDEQLTLLKLMQGIYTVNEKTMLEDSITKNQEKLKSLFTNIKVKEEDVQKRFELNKVNDSITIKDAKLKDSYYNDLLAIGNEADRVGKYDTYGFDNSTLNWILWTNMYQDSWEFRMAIDKPAEDEINCGFTLFLDDVEKKNKILDKYNLHKEYFIDLLKWSALYGGAILFMAYEGLNDEDFTKPITDATVLAKIRKNNGRYIPYVTDRWYGLTQSQELVKKTSDIDYGKPNSYLLLMNDGSTKQIHHDYILRATHRKAPMFIQKGYLQGWGYAEGVHIFNALLRNDKLKSSVQSLINKALIEIVKISGMGGLFLSSDPQAKELIKARLEQLTWLRNTNSITFLDPNDSYEQNGFSGLSGLSDLIGQNMWEVSAALDMPNYLYGQLNNGFGSDSDAIPRINKTLKNRCVSFLQPVLMKYLKNECVIYEINDTPKIEFKDVFKTEMNEKKLESIEKFTSVGGELIDRSVITDEQFAKATKLYIEEESIDFNLTDENIEKALKSAPSELEDINLDEDEKIDNDLKLTKEEKTDE